MGISRRRTTVPPRETLGFSESSPATRLTTSSRDPSDTFVDIHKPRSNINEFQSGSPFPLQADDLILGSLHVLGIGNTRHELRNSLEFISSLRVLQRFLVCVLQRARYNKFLRKDDKERRCITFGGRRTEPSSGTDSQYDR